MHRFLAALALAIGVSSAAQAQTVKVVAGCTGYQAQNGGPLMVDENGRLCMTSAAGSGTVASAGTNRSGTVGTTAANLLAANTSRRGFWLKNDTATDVWCSFDGTATAVAGSGNFKVAQSAYFASEPGFVSTNALSCIVASGSAAVTAREH